MTSARVRLERFSLRSYRSLKETSFNINPGVTALIGRNGAGKTNLLHGLLLIEPPDRRFRSRLDDDDIYMRECQLEADFKIGKNRALFRSNITYSPSESRDAVITSKEKWRFIISGKKSRVYSPEDMLLRQQGGGIGLDSPRTSYTEIDLERIINTPRSLLFKKIPPDAARSLYTKVFEFRSGISYYSASQFTNPGHCPTSFKIDNERRLDRVLAFARKSPHARFIFDLFKLSKEDSSAYERYLSLVDANGLNLIKRIKWREIKFAEAEHEVRAGGRVVKRRQTQIMIIPTVYIGNAQLSFNQLSEGTLRTLAMLFYVSTDKGQLLLIEEPEICVHHGLLNSVIEIINEFARTKQIVITTHSEAVVDSLKPDQVLLVTNSNRKGTEAKSLSESLSAAGYSALKRYLSTSGNLGEYWRHRGFDR